MSARAKMAVGCSARYMDPNGPRVKVLKLWTDGLGRQFVTWQEYAHGVSNECSGALDGLVHSPGCASANCPERDVDGQGMAGGSGR